MKQSAKELKLEQIYINTSQIKGHNLSKCYLYTISALLYFKENNLFNTLFLICQFTKTFRDITKKKYVLQHIFSFFLK